MLVRVGQLPDSAVKAAGTFHERDIPRVLAALVDGFDVVLVFPPTDQAHRAWRSAVVQGLAREHAPLRVNGVAVDDEAAIAAAEDYLARAPGVTGQYFTLDGEGAGNPLG